jgi:hypothetical protein
MAHLEGNQNRREGIMHWLEGLVMGLCLGAVPTAFSFGAMHGHKMAMTGLTGVIREARGALSDIAGRISGLFNKGEKKSGDEAKAGAGPDGRSGTAGGGVEVQPGK